MCLLSDELRIIFKINLKKSKLNFIVNCLNYSMQASFQKVSSDSSYHSVFVRDRLIAVHIYEY